MANNRSYTAVVIGGSAGGGKALGVILPVLPLDFPLPVLVVKHLHPDDDGGFARHLAMVSRRRVIEPCDKEPVEAGNVYTAPADYHMLVEKTGSIALSVDGKVNFSRPSIDVLFESAAVVWGEAVIAVLLSGASSDGTSGMLSIRATGGVTIAQDPACAEYPLMPQSAMDARAVGEVLPAGEIGGRLVWLGARGKG
jgi:two-component system chemotaxis response regulator CheB